MAAARELRSEHGVGKVSTQQIADKAEIDLPPQEGAGPPRADGRPYWGSGGRGRQEVLAKTATVSYGVGQPILPTVRLNLHR
nr:TetR/AcrR family transcriptional regulator [Arthrobacter sp. Soil736]